MIKQIRADQLKPGMYIHDLNCGWLDHPFVANTFQVRDQETVDKIANLGIRELYIDTLKGARTAVTPGAAAMVSQTGQPSFTLSSVEL